MALASLSSAISGLQTNNEWMTVIANNIANVNSIAYKEQRMTFADQIYQTLGAASGANAGENLGGINPEELGLGDVVGSVDMIMSQGAIQTTGNALDVAITGQGFFEVKSGSNVNFTRAGNFGQDDVGNIVTSSGAILQGWQGAVVRQMGDVDPGLNPQLELDAETYKINTAQAPSNLSIQPGLTLE